MKPLFFIALYFVTAIGHGQSIIDQFFSEPTVHRVDISFNINNYWDSLTHYKSIDDQTGVNNYVEADIFIDSILFSSVGMRFRGNSSYNHPGTKKPFQIDFNEFNPGQTFHGLKKLNLNNSYLDPTQIREKLFLDILNEEGLPAPRCTFTEVYIGGEYVGLYKFIEPIKKTFLSDHFGNNDGNLYKGEPKSTLAWEGSDQSLYYDNCELKTNEGQNDWSGLIEAIRTINHTPVEVYHTQVENVINLDNFVHVMAVNNLFGNLDSYQYLPHNYYLYQNEQTNKFEWIVWDVSLAFGMYAILVVPESIGFDIEYTVNNAREARPLSYYTFQNQALRADYMNHICRLLSSSFTGNYLFPRIDSLAELIRPYVYAEPVKNQMFSPTQFESNLEYAQASFNLIGKVPGLKDFILKRSANVRKQLCHKNWSCSDGTEVPSGSDYLTVYPNPGSEFTVETAAPVENSAVRFDVYDMSGRRIFEQVAPSDHERLFKVDLSALPAGMYVIKSHTGCRAVSKKVVVVD